MLTLNAAKAAKPKKKEYSIKDGLGLFLSVLPSGGKYWAFRFSWQGKQQRISLGVFPDVDIKTARERRDACRELIITGLDPRLPRRKGIEDDTETVKSVTFAEYAENWKTFKLLKLAKKRGNIQSKGLKQKPERQSTKIQIERYLRLDFLPSLGEIPIKDIKRQDILSVLRKIEKRGSLSIVKKCMTWLNEIFRFAIAEGLIEMNPASDLDILLLEHGPAKNNPHLAKEELPKFLYDLRNYKGEYQTMLGLRLLLLTGVRTGELRFAFPEEFDLDKKLWLVPPETVKQLQRKVFATKEKIPAYIVPLSEQAVEVVKELLSLCRPGQKYLLSHRTEPMQSISENTLNHGLHRMGYKDKLTGHGIRATISTALHEMNFPSSWIDAQLSHSDKNTTRLVYNHAQYVEDRRGMMQTWADTLDELEKSYVPVVLDKLVA
ncbi:tyrosine-type recombinase/integrase [Zophobihabitans entericus]|uniref:Tyrosine-type recombinase/integrase n=2 Tax=Zophobihabitans entericus TaxID=1635327 RepID=A0A6G9IFA4_9GAMM|nr:tyrosine-type recombinase/integrase [Zophobihabitans entericus]